MFVIYTKKDFDGQYILFADNCLDKLKNKFLNFYENNKDDYDFNNVLAEKELDSFGLYSHDCKFYYSKIEGLDADKDIFIFQFKQEEEIGYNNNISFVISNEKENLLKIATDYLEGESEKTEPKHITQMLNSLSKKGIFNITNGRGYLCEMKIIDFIPLKIK
jgi:hypothetical protein